MAKTTFYAVYLKSGDADPYENAVFVKQGFSVLAGVIPFIWFLYHKSFLISFMYFVVLSMLSYFQIKEGLDMSTIMVLRAGIFAFAGFTASDIYERALEKKKYTFCAVLSGRDEMEARLRFIEHYDDMVTPSATLRPAPVTPSNRPLLPELKWES